MDRNSLNINGPLKAGVALRKESVDRNSIGPASLTVSTVALRKESVDRNFCVELLLQLMMASLSARRAWIEIVTTSDAENRRRRRSPQGERG